MARDASLIELQNFGIVCQSSQRVHPFIVFKILLNIRDSHYNSYYIFPSPLLSNHCK